MNCWSIKSFVLCRCIVEDNFAVPSGVGSRHEFTYEPWKTLRAPLKNDGPYQITWLQLYAHNFGTINCKVVIIMVKHKLQSILSL